MAWRCPESRPGNDAALFKQAHETIETLRTQHEQVLIARLPIVSNQEAYGAMIAEVEREFVGARTILRGQLRLARNRHRALLETELQTMYGWPPKGPGPSLKRAARQYLAELGPEHPLVEDFVLAARRHIKEKEDKCIQELGDLEKDILKFRGLVNADPPAPKLMRDSYVEQLNEKSLDAIQRLDLWSKEIGTDSAVYLRFLRSVLDTEPYLDQCEAQASTLVEELRSYGPRPPPSLEENHITEARAIASTSLAFYIEALEADGRSSAAAAFRGEMSGELRRVREAVALFKEPVEENEGWHKPPGYDQLDIPDPPPPPPPPPPPKKEFRLDRELPGMREKEGLTMRLHGVGFEDVNRHHELLLLEMCADIIAEECKIPRDCIFNMSFSDPNKVEAEAEVEAEVPVLPEGAMSKELVTEPSLPVDSFTQDFKNPLLTA